MENDNVIPGIRNVLFVPILLRVFSYSVVDSIRNYFCYLIVL
jgi:hypothetical protein